MNIFHVYHVDKTVGETTESHYAFAPPGDIETLSVGEHEIPGTKRFVSLTEMVEHIGGRHPDIIFKLPPDMPAYSSRCEEGMLVEYVRRGISPRERDDFVARRRGVFSSETSLQETG